MKPVGTTEAMDAPSNSASASPAVLRAAAALEAIAASESGSLSLSDLARQIGIPKSSASNILQALEDTQLVGRVGGNFRLGQKLVELGASYVNRRDEVREFHQFCEESPVLSRETVRMAMLDGSDVIYLARYEGHPAVRFTSNVGDKMPASLCAVGKALLAKRHDEDLKELYPPGKRLPGLTEHSLRTRRHLLTQLQSVRARGWAFEDEEATLGVVCVGVAIPTHGMHGANLGLSVTALKATFTPKLQEQLVAELKTLARLLGAPLSR